ncbi:MAG: hypothetical protein IPL74_11910 [Bacteroidetes bacterium]|nr:hypothetical protein [Bacteroidota bacterium]
MSISVRVLPNANVTASVTGGGVTIVKIQRTEAVNALLKQLRRGEATISVTAKLDGKEMYQWVSLNIVIERVPDPVAMINGKKRGTN